MSADSLNSVVKQRLLGVLLASLGTIVFAFNIPWRLLCRNAIPAGGDNPAHPVLIHSLAEAFFQHFSVVHYSYSFWGGFEMFQYYFPLPYLVGAFLGKVVGINIAFKIITIVGILGLPPAFYAVARDFGASRVVGALASLLGLSFLYTEAHVMWGANIYSTFAGMIGNSWAFAFALVAIGKLYKARETHSFTWPGLLFSVLTMLSHFFALFMLFILYGVFVLEDAAAWLAGRVKIRQLLPFYLTGFCSVLLVCWWMLPLFFYQPYSSQFGGDWIIKFFDTFNLIEKIFFGLALLIGSAELVRTRFQDRALRLVLIYGAVFTALFFLNAYLHSAAFTNIRLWPTIYFSLFLFMILVVERLYRRLPLPVFALLLASFFVLLPGNNSFVKSTDWMNWNFGGLEERRGWEDLSGMLTALRAQPPGRISFESDDLNNSLLGSVRVFEMLPYLTRHEIIEGGIVNSASFPGIAYTLQCLTSTTCAGWPPGSFVPGRDAVRAVDFMRTLGVDYHIASKPANRQDLEKTGAFDVLYDGKFFGLFRLKPPSSKVEVFEPPILSLNHRRPNTSLLALPRFDAWRDAAFVFDAPAEDLNPALFKGVSGVDFFTTLLAEWRGDRRVVDRGWEDRAKERQKYLNGCLFFWNNKAVLNEEMLAWADPFVADRGFDPAQMVLNFKEGNSELGCPLMRDLPGAASVTVYGNGYFGFVNDRPLEFGKSIQIDFKDASVGGIKTPFAFLRFVPDKKMASRFVDILTDDSTIRSGVPGGRAIEPPLNITSDCQVRLEKSFQRMVLHTSCPGKPHLIKYSYYPKWQADVPIYLGTNGFMLLVPKSETTVLNHKRGVVDWLGIALSLLGVLGLMAGWFICEKRPLVEKGR